MSNTSKFENACDYLRQIFSLPRSIFVTVAILITWRLLPYSPADPDLFARIAMGRLVEKFGAVPLHDPFAFTEKLPLWIDHEWLSGVVFYFIASCWGDAGLILLKVALALWTCSLVIRASITLYPSAACRILWLNICLLEASFVWVSTVRCQIFTYFFIALTYYGFSQYRVNQISRYIFLIPFACIGLVNMHGGYALEIFILSILTIGSFLERKHWKSLAAVLLLSSLAPIFTPYGFKIFVGYLIHALSMKRVYIPEWHAIYTDPVYLIRSSLITLPLLAGIFISLKKRSFDFIALLITAFALYCGFKHIRFVGFAMLTAAIFGSQYFGLFINFTRGKFISLVSKAERSVALVGTIVFAAMLGQIILSALQARTWRLRTEGYPIKAIESLRSSDTGGKLLVNFDNGSFALWRLYPKFLISVDGRYEEVYTDQTVRDTALAFSPDTPDGLAALHRIAPTHILFNISQCTERVRAALSPSWSEVYRDEKHVVYSTSQKLIMPKYQAVEVQDLWRNLF